MTVDEIMTKVELHYYADTYEKRWKKYAEIRAALEAQAARIEELEDVLRNIALALCSDARSVALAKGALKPKVETTSHDAA